VRSRAWRGAAVRQDPVIHPHPARYLVERVRDYVLEQEEQPSDCHKSNDHPAHWSVPVRPVRGLRRVWLV